MSNFDEGVFPRLLPDFLLSKFQHLPFSSCFSHIFPYMSIYFHIFPYIYFHIIPYISIFFPYIFPYISSIWMVGFPRKNPPFWGQSKSRRADFFLGRARQAQMAQYLCSTNADETLHGDQLPVATHIRPWEPYRHWSFISYKYEENPIYRMYNPIYSQLTGKWP